MDQEWRLPKSHWLTQVSAYAIKKARERKKITNGQSNWNFTSTSFNQSSQVTTPKMDTIITKIETRSRQTVYWGEKEVEKGR